MSNVTGQTQLRTTALDTFIFCFFTGVQSYWFFGSVLWDFYWICDIISSSRAALRALNKVSDFLSYLDRNYGLLTEKGCATSMDNLTNLAAIGWCWQVSFRSSSSSVLLCLFSQEEKQVEAIFKIWLQYTGGNTQGISNSRIEYIMFHCTIWLFS